MSLKMAVPNKGRLNERAIELLIKSGLDLGEDWGRKLYVKVKNKDIEVVFVRSQDIPVFVHSGAVDIGITGQDLVADSEKEVKEILQLQFGKCRLSLAVPENSNIKKIDDVPEGTRIATSFVNVTKKYFKSKKKNIQVIPVTGAAEIMPYMGVADCIVDLVSSGSTLKTNRLIEIEPLMESQAIVIANSKSLKSNSDEIYDVVNAIQSVISAESKKYLMADAPKKKLKDIQSMFPGLAGPTVMNIAGNDEMVAIHVVIEADEIYDAVNKLKKLGGKGILTLPIDRLVQ